MTKKYQKIIVILLVLVLLLTSFVACKPKNNDNGGATPVEDLKPTKDPATNPQTAPTEHLSTNVLHKVNVTEGNLPFAVNGACEYVLVYTNTTETYKAATLIQRHVRLHTGATVDLQEYNSQQWSADKKYIVLNVPALFDTAGGVMPTDDLGQRGYYIKSIGNSVFIAVLADTGCQLGAISFLNHVIGFKQYSSDTVVYTKTGETLPTFDIIERPDFEYYVTGNKISSEGSYGMGYSGSLFVPVDGENWHNTMNYLPPEVYKSANPDWYSTAGDELCYTARGNEESYNSLVQIMAEKVLMYASQYPDRPLITITIEDAHRSCQCDACAQSRKDYGGVDSAALIKLVNQINRVVQAKLQEEADQSGSTKRTLYILFFAYFNMEKPPVKQNADGTYSPIDQSVVLDDNVGVYIAPIYASYNQSFYHDDNISAKQTIDGWASCAKNLFMWLYETNYSHYLYPLNSYDTMLETFRYCQISGARFMFPEGQYNQGSVSHFSRVKEYFDSVATFNVNINYEDMLDDFFTNYFREAAEPMREFFDQLQAQLRYLEVTYPAQVNGNIYNNMANQEYWPKKMLDGWLDLCDEAYKAIEKYQTTDPELYQTLCDHIKLETIFPRYAILCLHQGKYSAEALKEMQLAFREDCRYFNITNHSETQSIDEIFASWGLL